MVDLKILQSEKFAKNPAKFLRKSMTSFLGEKKVHKKSSCHTQFDKGFHYYAEIQSNLMIQFHENTPTDSRMERWTDPTS